MHYFILPAAHRFVDVHGVNVSETGSDLHPVLLDPQQVFFHEVHREASSEK